MRDVYIDKLAKWKRVTYAPGLSARKVYSVSLYHYNEDFEFHEFLSNKVYDTKNRWKRI